MRVAEKRAVALGRSRLSENVHQPLWQSIFFIVPLHGVQMTSDAHTRYKRTVRTKRQRGGIVLLCVTVVVLCWWNTQSNLGSTTTVQLITSSVLEQTKLKRHVVVPPYGLATLEGLSLESVELYTALRKRLRGGTYAEDTAGNSDLLIAVLPPYLSLFARIGDDEWMKMERPGFEGDVNTSQSPVKYAQYIMCTALAGGQVPDGFEVPHVFHDAHFLQRRAFAGKATVLVVPFDPRGCYALPSGIVPFLAFLETDNIQFTPKSMWTRQFEDLIAGLRDYRDAQNLHLSLQVPIVSSIRWSNRFTRRWQEAWFDHGAQPPIPPWQFHDRRPTLVSFTGSTRGSPRIRQHLLDACSASTVCVSLVQDGWWGPSYMRFQPKADYIRFVQKQYKKMLTIKQQSIFCLEPPGHGEMRKSAMDSILSGCIPVFFFKDKFMHNNVLPFFFNMSNGWGHDASIVFLIDDVLEGHVDVMDTLSNIPKDKIHKMQTVLSTNARRLSGNVGARRGDEAPDAADIVIDSLWRIYRRSGAATRLALG